MKNHYALPVCFAAAFHGALLFGFTKNPRPPPTPDEKPQLVPFVISQRDEDPPVLVEADRSDPQPKRAPDAPQPPRGAEPPVIDLGTRPTMPLPSFEPVAGLKDMKQIPEISAGTPGSDGDSPWKNGVIPSTLLDGSPRTRLQATPAYPFEAKRGGMSGEVVVEFLVDERGHVLEPRVVSSTHRIFEEATLRAVAKWQFEPGRRNGRIVRFRMAAPVVFNLND